MADPPTPLWKSPTFDVQLQEATVFINLAYDIRFEDPLNSFNIRANPGDDLGILFTEWIIEAEVPPKDFKKIINGVPAIMITNFVKSKWPTVTRFQGMLLGEETICMRHPCCRARFAVMAVKTSENQ